MRHSRHRSRKRKLQWFEPLYVKWRQKTWRELLSMRWMLARSVVWGTILGAGFHALLVLGLHVPLPVSLMKYYGIAVLATPGMMMFSIGITLIAPRGVSVQPTAIVIQNGQSAAALMADRVVQWRFCSIKGRPRSALFALRYTTRRHRHRTLVLALSKKVDILDLDRRMRLMKRLSQYRAMSNQRRHAR